MKVIAAFCLADVLWNLQCPIWVIGLAVGVLMEVGREAQADDHR